MKFKLIKTEEDYEFALQRLKEVFDAKPGTDAADELLILLSTYTIN
jgi:HTH-type transcriptional regulator/antitoxin HigA